MELLREEFDDFVSFLRQALALAALPPGRRRALRARRYEAAGKLARGAAAVQRAHAGCLPPLPCRPEDLEAQQERVELLAHLERVLGALGGEVSDTLLRERAELLHMGLAVAQGVEQARRDPTLSPLQRRRLGVAWQRLRAAAPVGTRLLRLASAQGLLPAPHRPDCRSGQGG